MSSQEYFHADDGGDNTPGVEELSAPYDTTDKSNPANTNDYAHVGMLNNARTENMVQDNSGTFDPGHFAEAFHPEDYPHHPSLLFDQSEGLNFYDFGTGDGFSLTNNNNMFASSYPLQLQQAFPGNPEAESGLAGQYDPVALEQTISTFNETFAGGKNEELLAPIAKVNEQSDIRFSGNNQTYDDATFGEPFSNALNNSTYNPANYATSIQERPDQSMRGYSMFAGIMNKNQSGSGPGQFQGNPGFSGSAQFRSNPWNAPTMNSRFEKRETFDPVPPFGRRSADDGSDQFSTGPIAIKPEEAGLHARSPSGSAQPHGEQWAPITSERELYVALNEHRTMPRKPSNYPHGNTEAQILLVGKIISAFRNIEGCIDSPKVLSTYNATYSDRQIEIAAWQMMLRTRDAQEGGALVRSWGDISKAEYEEHEDFSVRMEAVIENLTRSKAFCKSALAPSFMSRAADRPNAELNRKQVNKKLNTVKTALVKRGRGITDADAERIKKEKADEEVKQRKKRGRIEDDDENEDDEEIVPAKRQTRSSVKRGGGPGEDDSFDIYSVPKFTGRQGN